MTPQLRLKFEEEIWKSKKNSTYQFLRYPEKVYRLTLLPALSEDHSVASHWLEKQTENDKEHFYELGKVSRNKPKIFCCGAFIPTHLVLRKIYRPACISR